jgi:site-specific recombinase XerD
MLSFVRVARAKLIDDLTTRGVIAFDPGYLFLTNRGRPIDPETVTQDFHRLKRAAGIKGKASGHMLRHRWITLQVTERINAYATKRLPVDIGTTLLTKVASLTGHSLISSLKPYLHLATEELSIWDKGEQNFDDRSERDARDRQGHKDR